MQQDSPWQTKIASALSVHQHLPISRYLQLATVDTKGHPRCRTLVFRGLNPGLNEMYLHTDNRSEKVTQLESNHHVEACWYFSETREQFRFKGQIECIGHQNTSHSEAEQVRCAHWQNLSEALRESYGENYDDMQPDENFTLMILHITRVDYLRLAPLPHLRVIYDLDKSQNWQEKTAVP
jgi:PPOX class probable FMN-dependent enzyme